MKPFTSATLATLFFSLLLIFAGCKNYDDYMEEILEPQEDVEPAKPVERFNMDDIPVLLDGRPVLGSPGNRNIYLWGGRQDTMMLYRNFYYGVMSTNAEVVFANTDSLTGRVVMKPSGMGAVPLVLLAKDPAQNDTVICHVRNVYGTSWVTRNQPSLPVVRQMEVMATYAVNDILDSLRNGFFCDTLCRYSFWDDMIVTTRFLGGTQTETYRNLYSWSETNQQLTVLSGGAAKVYTCEVLCNKADSLRIALLCDETAHWDAVFPNAYVYKVVSVQYLDRIAMTGTR